MGLKDVVAADEYGIIYPKRKEGMVKHKAELALLTNPRHLTGSLADALKDADVFIGTSVPGCLTTEMIRGMQKDPVIFACANPSPEIYPDDALAAGAAVVCTGRSDFPNQVNNVLVFPGLFRGALDARASSITDHMKIAAAYAIAGLIGEKELRADYVLPSIFDGRVKKAVSRAVKDAAVKDGVSRIL